MRFLIQFPNGHEEVIFGNDFCEKLIDKGMIRFSHLSDDMKTYYTTPCDNRSYVEIISTLRTLEGMANAIRLPSDINGNPRYYLSKVSFCDNGEMYRPFNANMYRGKKFGPGWVFQTYNLANTLKKAYETHLKEKEPKEEK